MKYKLRPYQRDAIEAVFEAWENNRSALLVLPTGTGKTVVFTEILKRSKSRGRGMVLAHRRELVYQAAKSIHAATGQHPDIEMGDDVATESFWSKSDIVVSSIQTQSRGRKHRFDPDEFSVLIYDEGHHGVAISWRETMEYYQANPNLKVLGVTATPDRSDEQALGQVFDICAYSYELPDAVSDGWLVPLQAYPVTVTGLDYSVINNNSTSGELNQKELSTVMTAEEPIHEMVQAVVERSFNLAPHTLNDIATINKSDPNLFRQKMRDLSNSKRLRKTLIFSAGVEHAELFSDIINRWLPNQSNWVCGTTDKEDRKELISQYREHSYSFLCNHAICTEGFDDPNIEICVMGRPVKSRSAYAQMVGRCTRPHDSIAHTLNDLEMAPDRRALIAASPIPHAEIIDFVGNVGRHRLMSTADILGGKYEDEVVQKAAKMISESDGQIDPTQALEEAKEEYDKDAELAAKKAAKDKARGIIALTKYQVTKINNIFERMGVEPERERGYDTGRKPSEKMQATLERHKLWAEGLTFGQAKKLIQSVTKRHEEGLCTPRQAFQLKKHGYDPNMSFEEAGPIMAKLAKKFWGRRR